MKIATATLPMTDLYASALAVFYAFNSKLDEIEEEAQNPPFSPIAAALRAAAKQGPAIEIPFKVVKEWEEMKSGSCASFYAAAEWGYSQAINKQILIADQMEIL